MPSALLIAQTVARISREWPTHETDPASFGLLAGNCANSGQHLTEPIEHILNLSANN